jgi:RHS repeat-associated protein
MVLVLVNGTDVEHRLLWGPAVDQALADETGSGDVYWYLTDHLGTVRDVAEYNSGTNTTTVENHIVYDSFGRRTSETNSSLGAFGVGYTGKWFDRDTGLAWHWNRWYNPEIQRWMSEDPIGFEAGDANMYRYVGNTVTTHVDHSGLIGEMPGGGPTPQQPILNGPRCTGDWSPGPKHQISASLAWEHLKDFAHEAYPPIELVGGIFVEPFDWFVTGKEIYQDPSNPWSYGGLVPIIPGSISRYGDDLVDAARKKYPKKAYKPEDHHVTPKYLTDCPTNETFRLDAAYHQEITNAFRRRHAYGQEKLSPEEIKKIKDKVYEEYPLIPFREP